MRNCYEISADLVTSSDVRHVTRVPHSCEAHSIAGHVTRDTCGRGRCYEASYTCELKGSCSLGQSRQRPDHHLLSPCPTSRGEVTAHPHTDLHNITSRETME